MSNPSLFYTCWKPIELDAWVILPDHFHVILNVGDNTISNIVHIFKIRYSKWIRQHIRPGRVWHNRFWDHIIRDQKDYNIHLDYIHYNPIRHGLTNDPFSYSQSSLNRFYNAGYYQRDWGVKPLEFDNVYGE